MVKHFRTKQDKEIIKNVSGAFLIKGAALLVSFASMPVYIKFFNNEEVLGLWFTILSILSWILTFDFGIGNGLRNHLVKPLEEKNSKSTKEYISSAYITLALFTILIAIIVIPIILFLNWNTILNISSELVRNETLRYVMGINAISIIMQFFFRIISSIFYALQMSVVNNFMALITSVSQLLFALFYIGGTPSDNLIVLSYVYLICVNFPLIITTIVIFITKLKGMSPSIKMFDKAKANTVFFDGSKIFVNQLLYLVLTGTNSFLITRLINNIQVVEYQQYYRIFMLIGSLYLIVLTPLWSGVTKAHINKDYHWINKYFKLTVLGSFIVLFAQLLIIPFLQFGFDIWLGDNAPQANYLYALIFAIFGFVFTFQSTVSTFAMGFNKTKLQAKIYGVAVVLKVLLSLWLVSYYPYWIIFVLVDIVTFAPYCILEYFDIRRIINTRLILLKESTLNEL